MKLVLDFGNTLQKMAIFEGDKMIEMYAFKKITLRKLHEIIANFPIKSAILSSVINYPEEIKIFLQHNFNFIEFNSTTNIPLINKYASPETLGNDRLAAAVAANHLFPDQNVLVIIAGTCITYEFVNNKNEYLGGAISPGIGIRFKSLHNFTDKLPLIEKKIKTAVIGNTTEKSILSGVMNGVYCEVDGVTSKYTADYKNLQIILSGGDMKYFANSLKNSIFAVSNIVLIGLNIILDFNAKN
ncbi:MAG: type III pantothenate kinase [Bacteroidetes bacterium]|nr:type III pantothenate kinase [Bacteroidota bacterium]